MARIALPYGKGCLTADIPDDRLAGVLVSRAHEYRSDKSEEGIVLAALENPVGSPRLRDLARGRKNIVIISSDHTRPVPSRVTMPPLLAEIRAGAPDADVTILVATGGHRASSREELTAKYGDEIVRTTRIVMHDSRDESAHVRIGTLPSGGSLDLDKCAWEADLLAAEGFIEPHFFAGFSGGRKSVLPGIVSYPTVMANHCSEFIASDRARTGILDGNPLHIDMLYAAEQARLAFILNVVIDADKHVIAAFAGHRERAHETGCAFVSDLAGVDARPADIVITSNGGYPLDQNIYQSVKGMTAAEAACKPGGVIIIASECSDGHGGESFYRAFAEEPSVRKIMDGILARGRDETIPDQWEIQVLARILLQYTVIMVTSVPKKIVEDMSMKWACDMETAISMAKAITGGDHSTFTVIPDGIAVIVRQ